MIRYYSGEFGRSVKLAAVTKVAGRTAASRYFKSSHARRTFCPPQRRRNLILTNTEAIWDIIYQVTVFHKK